MRIAVIDLGTNTCNLLIGEVNNTFKILHQSKELVKLGDSKINTNEISEEATDRILKVLRIHEKIIQRFDVEKIRLIATSAFRSAVNKEQIRENIHKETGMITEVISGEKEAQLIFKGVLLAVSEFKNPSVILDIGGGSNELILASGRKMLWKESRPSGIGRVINRFKISDPIGEKEIESLREFFLSEHQFAFKECIDSGVKTLFGCSGAFDTIADIIDRVEPGQKKRTTQQIELDDFYAVFNKLIVSTHAERIKMKGMDMVRVDLIVPAVIFIERVISGTGITKITQTDYALREGVLFEMMEQRKFMGESKHQQSRKSS